MSEHVGISIIDWSSERVYIMCVSVCLSMSTMVPVDAAMCLGPLSRHWSHLVWLGDYNLLTHCWECSHTSLCTCMDKTVVMMKEGGKGNNEGCSQGCGNIQRKLLLPGVFFVVVVLIFFSSAAFLPYFLPCRMWSKSHPKGPCVSHFSYPLSSSDTSAGPSVEKLLCFGSV